ncbi:unnamed protein product [Bursaphelenchus xylophilus]|uniref:(pine wood nematode) hypothetical protein n=1 Tax=Bursaphelenchus xylophilus TaxID=6326 RepID=A0A7I8WYK7_BURXY|nr:unnamed protein product [Bursaphelenchus xylophilus]CAG9100807.1 unnamed protein product [Bursaphelenchus xylophilus]
MHLVLNLALFLFFASVTNSIRCYTCNEDASRRGTDCVKSKITIKDCGNDNGCIKGLLKLESLEIRYKKCAPNKINEDKCTDRSYNGFECSCRGDLCNNSPGDSSSLIVIVTLLVFFMIF